MFVFVIILNLEFLSLSWVGMKPFTFDLVTWWSVVADGRFQVCVSWAWSGSETWPVGVHCGASGYPGNSHNALWCLCRERGWPLWTGTITPGSGSFAIETSGRSRARRGGNQNRPTEREVWCGRLAGGNSHVGEHLGATWTDEKHATFNKCRWSLLGVSMPQTAAANLRLFDNASQMIGRHEKKTCVCACVG